MFRILVDTCVWLDVAKDPKQHPLIGIVEELVRQERVRLIVPSVVRDEFRRNRARIATESAKSLSTHFRLVKDAVDRLGGNKRRVRVVLAHLDDVGHKLPIIGGTAAGVLDRIETLLASADVIDVTDPIRLRAAQRAMDGRAPFHRGTNAMADAIIIETYAECVRAKGKAGERFAFVTHNRRDFSVEGGNHNLPHPDVAEAFSGIRSLYVINLAEGLRRIEPALVTNLMLEHSWTQEPRGLSSILEAEDLLFHQVWYNRHWNMRARIDRGEIRVVETESYPRPRGAPETIQRKVLKGAIRSARRAERRYGKKNLGPWDDFEWGMINGKLSALRWVLGDEWDMLDT